MLDYDVKAGQGVEVELEAGRINKRHSRAGLALGGKCQAPGGARHSNNLGQCFLCEDQATTQVTEHLYISTLHSGWALGYRCLHFLLVTQWYSLILYEAS